MANEIKSKFGTGTAITHSLASMASSAAGVGQTCQQTDLVDNTTNRYSKVHVFAKVKLGTSPAAGAVYFYLIKKDATNSIATDAAGASAASFTRLSARLVRTAATKTAPATGDVVQCDFEIYDPGPTWGLAVGQDTTVALDSTAGNHVLSYIGDNPEVQ